MSRQKISPFALDRPIDLRVRPMRLAGGEDRKAVYDVAEGAGLDQ
jgi:hypothetical protein